MSPPAECHTLPFSNFLHQHELQKKFFLVLLYSTTSALPQPTSNYCNSAPDGLYFPILLPIYPGFDSSICRAINIPFTCNTWEYHRNFKKKSK